MTLTRPIRKLAPYAPLAWHQAALRDKSLVLLATGSAGGGKSRFAGEKGHMFSLKYPGSTGLVVRKTREAAARSCVPMLWQSVIGGERSGVIFNQSDNMFKYPNGSVIYTGGLKDEAQREAIRSIGGKGAVDWIWVEEASALTVEDYQELLARLRGNSAPWLQIILTTNPGSPAHWINQRLILGGEASVYYSGAKDNPYNPPQYLKILETLTGTQYQRLVLGRWVQSEGAIYDNFSAIPHEGNVTEEAEYNPAWPVVWGVDDGYAEGKGKGSESYHPRAFLLGQFTPQGGLNIFAEYGRTLEVEETSLTNVLNMPYPKPDIAYVDSSAAQLRGRIWGHSIQTIGATHVVTEGIKNLRRLVCDGNGVRLLKVHPRCKEFINEMQSYEYADSNTSVNGERKPAKLNDHFCFVAGTLIETDSGSKPIEAVRKGDYVLTRKGYQAVSGSGITQIDASVVTVTINDDYSLTGTEDHPVYTSNRGFVSLHELGIDDIILVSNSIKDTSPCPKELYQKSNPLSITKSRLDAIQNPSGSLISAILSPIVFTLSKVWNIFTAKSGNMNAALSLRDTISTTLTGIQATTQLTISNASPLKSIGAYTLTPCQTNAAPNFAHAWTPYAIFPLRGMGHPKDWRGTNNTVKKWASVCANLWNTTANNAARLMQPLQRGKHAFAATTANQDGVVKQGLMTAPAHAPIAETNLSATSTLSKSFVAVRVQNLDVKKHANLQTVYNLTVPAVPEYFANGVLVHNCDCARYLGFRLRYDL